MYLGACGGHVVVVAVLLMSGLFWSLVSNIMRGYNVYGVVVCVCGAERGIMLRMHSCF